MKLQFKTETLLKDVDSLIEDDNLKRVEVNRKVDIILGKIREYLDNNEREREDVLNKAKGILDKYSDDRLKELFLEEVIVREGGLFWWERNFYPDVSMIVEDLYNKGIIPVKCFGIEVDW